MNVDRIDQLLWIEEIKRLKAQYFWLVDSKDWRGLKSLFAASATLTYPASHDGPVNLDAAIELIATGLQDVASVHHGHMPDIEILSESTAKGLWAMEDILLFSPGNTNARGRQSQRGYGHYTETYTRIDGQWKIQTLRLSRLLLIQHCGDQTGKWLVSPY